MEPMKPMQPMKPMEFQQGARWWPEEFGQPSSSGSQNDVQYAYFRNARRLLVRDGQQTTTYDTGSYDIHGVFQASDAAHAVFKSDHGVVDLSQLKRV